MACDAHVLEAAARGITTGLGLNAVDQAVLARTYGPVRVLIPEDLRGAVAEGDEGSPPEAWTTSL